MDMNYIVDNNIIVYESSDLIKAMHEFLCYVFEKANANMDFTKIRIERVCMKENKKYPMVFEIINITSDYILLNNLNLWINLKTYSPLHMANILNLNPNSSELKALSLLINNIIYKTNVFNQQVEILVENNNNNKVNNKTKQIPDDKNILEDSSKLLDEISKNLSNMKSTKLSDNVNIHTSNDGLKDMEDYFQLKEQFNKEIKQEQEQEKEYQEQNRELNTQMTKINNPTIKIVETEKNPENTLETIAELEKFKQDLDKQIKMRNEEIKKESETYANHMCLIKDNEQTLKNKKKKEEEKKRKFISEKEYTYNLMKNNLFIKKKSNGEPVWTINNIPTIFLSQFYVYLYMDGLDIEGNEVRKRTLDTENEFEIFNMLYKAMTEEDEFEPPDDENLCNYICDFIDQLPDTKIYSYEEINNNLNQASENKDIFEDLEYENSDNSDNSEKSYSSIDY